MRGDAGTVPFECHQHLSQCDSHLRLRLLTTVPRAARLRCHHAVEPLFDECPPALDSDLVGAACVEHPPIPANPPRRRARCSTGLHRHVHDRALVGQRHGHRRGVQRVGKPSGAGHGRYHGARPRPLHQPGGQQHLCYRRSELPELETGRCRHRQRIERDADGDRWALERRDLQCPVLRVRTLVAANPVGTAVQRGTGHGRAVRAPDLLRGIQGPDWSRHGSKRDERRRGHS